MALGRLHKMNGDKRMPSAKGIHQNKQLNDTRKPVRIPNKLLGKMVNSLPKTAKQGRNTIHKLGVHPDSKTGDVNPYAGVNISAIRQRYNSFIKPFGYEMRCRESDKPILDADGDASGQKLWGLYILGEGD